MTTPEQLAARLDDHETRIAALENPDAGETTTPPPTPVGLQPPAGFTAVLNSDRSVTCRWTPASGATHTEVHEFEVDPAATLKATLAVPTAERKSSVLQGGKNYTYAARSKDADGLSVFSERVTVYVPASGEATTPAPPTTPSVPAGAKHPTDVIPEFKRWTTMTTTGAQGDPDNDFYIGKSIPDVYYVQEDGGVVFNCDPNGNHSPGSKYARVENRMQNANPGIWEPKSAWSSSGNHTLEAVLSGDTSKLSGRKRGNLVQIHDGGDDVMQVQMREGQGLGFAHDDGKSWVSIDPAYRDGQKFACKVIAAADRIQVLYNGVKKVDVPKKGTGWYWKIGAYSQTGGASEFKEPAGARFKVVVYSCTVTGGAV